MRLFRDPATKARNIALAQTVRVVFLGVFLCLSLHVDPRETLVYLLCSAYMASEIFETSLLWRQYIHNKTSSQRNFKWRALSEFIGRKTKMLAYVVLFITFTNNRLVDMLSVRIFGAR